MARFTETSSSVVSANVVAGANITSGDVLYTSGSDSRAFPVSLNTSSMAGFTDTIDFYPQVLNSESTGTVTATAVLTSGNVVCVFANSSQVKFGIYNTSGVIQGSITTVESGLGTISCATVCALTGGGFVVAYNNGTTNYKHAVFTNAGVQTTAPAVVSGVAVPSSSTTIASLAIGTGGYVLAYANTTSAVMFSQFNSTGVLQYTEATAESTSSSQYAGNGIDMCLLSTGNFVIAWRNSSSVVRFGIYNTSNALQGSITTAIGGDHSVRCVKVTGGFVVMGFTGTSVRFNKFNNSGVLQTGFSTSGYDATLTAPQTANTTNCIRLLPNSNTGGFFLLSSGYYSKWTADCQMIDFYASVGNYQYATNGAVSGSTMYITGITSSSYPTLTKITCASVSKTSYHKVPASTFPSGVISVPIPTSTVQSSGLISCAAMNSGYTLVVNGDTTYGVAMHVVDEFGKLVTSRVISYNAMACYCVDVCRMNNGNMAVAYGGGGSFFNVDIYDNDLNLLYRYQNTGTYTVNANIRVRPLSNGNIAVVFNNTSTNINAVILTNTGTVAVNPFAIYSGDASQYGVLGLSQMDDGGFVVASQNTTTSGQIARVSATGVVTFSTTYSSATGTNQVAVVGLPNNYYVVIARIASTLTHFIHAPSNVRIRTVTMTVDSTARHIDAFRTIDNLGYYLGTSDANYYQIHKYSNGGDLLSLFTTNMTAIEAQSMCVLQNGAAVFVSTPVTNVIGVGHMNPEVTIIGVASGDCVAGNTASVVVNGQASLRYNWPSQQFNQLGVGGVRGRILGKTALLDDKVNSLG